MTTSKRRPTKRADDSFLTGTELEERQRLYEMLMRVPASVAILAGPDLRFEFLNDSYRKLLGIKGDVVGRPIGEVVPDLEQAIMDLMYGAAKRGERFESNEMPVTLDWDGKDRPYTKYLSLAYEPLFDEAGRPDGLTVFAHDISEQVKARQEVEASRALLEMITNAIPAFIAYVDADRRYRFVNRAYEEWFGLPMSSVVGASTRKILGRATYAHAGQYMEKALRGEKVAFDVELQREDKTRYTHGDYIPDIGPDGTVQGFVVVGSDITERKLAEIRLRASESRFRFMAESMPQKIFTALPDKTMTYLNPQWQQYSGIKVNEMLRDGLVFRKLIHPDDYPNLRTTWSRAFESNGVAEFEFRMRRHDGEYRWHIGRMNPMKDEHGTTVMWVGSVTDIDDMKRATERRHELEIRTAALTQQRAQLLALNKAKDEFISLASHQLRTPATGVKQFLGMLLEGYAGPITDDQKVFLETAYESNERQINIVNDLLQVARIDAGKVSLKKRKTDLVRLLKSAVNEHAAGLAERDQKLVLRLPAGSSVKARVDPDRIRMVLDNVIDNAGKYTTSGKTITITARERNGMAEVAVADQGVGMTRDEISRIFQKFSRLENPHTKGVEGSGLGLYWAKKIIDLHGGKIGVKSAIGKGTTFTISLPL